MSGSRGEARSHPEMFEWNEYGAPLKMDVSLRETGVGGVAGTPFGQAVAEKMMGK